MGAGIGCFVRVVIDAGLGCIFIDCVKGAVCYGWSVLIIIPLTKVYTVNI